MERSEVPQQVLGPAETAGEPGNRVRPSALFLAFLRLGATAFGGPAMVAYIGELATRRKWASGAELREGVALCQAIPGATAMQMAAYVGLRASGVRGAFAAYVGFGLPAVALMVTASMAYGQLAGLAWAAATFQGLHAMIVALAANATVDVARRNVRSLTAGAVAAGCALALYFRAAPVVVIAAAAALEVLIHRGESAHETSAPGLRSAGTFSVAARIAVMAALGVAMLATFAPRLGSLATVFMKVDALAFGGGFASVPLMFHEVVETRGWLDARTFMDGIALGQVTPGPIVVTATFVGHRVAGLAGALVATVAIFLPSFLLVVTLAPWFGRFRAHAWFTHAVHGAMLSFAGLLAVVSLRLASEVAWSAGTAGIAGLAFLALQARAGMLWVVLASGALSFALRWL